MVYSIFKAARDRTTTVSVREATGQLLCEATILMQAELSQYPDLSGKVPATFLEALKAAGTGATLRLEEQAAIILAEKAASLCAAVMLPEISEDIGTTGGKHHEFITLKWQSVTYILREASCDQNE
jgi:hypothetical protein